MRESRRLAAELWPRLEPRGLSLVGVIAALVGLGWLGIAANPSPDAQVAGEFRPFAAAVGVATLGAGILAVFRLREDLVVSILGALTGASFAVAVALTTRPGSTWSVFWSATVFGGLFLGVVAFRGAFRHIADVTPADERDDASTAPASHVRGSRSGRTRC
jgi:hypothetical protein